MRSLINDYIHPSKDKVELQSVLLAAFDPLGLQLMKRRKSTEYENRYSSRTYTLIEQFESTFIQVRRQTVGEKIMSKNDLLEWSNQIFIRTISAFSECADNIIVYIHRDVALVSCFVKETIETMLNNSSRSIESSWISNTYLRALSQMKVSYVLQLSHLLQWNQDGILGRVESIEIESSFYNKRDNVIL